MRFLSNRNNVPLYVSITLFLLLAGVLIVSPRANAEGLEDIPDPDSDEHYVRTAVGWMEAFPALQEQYFEGPGDGEYGDLEDLVAVGYFPPYFTKDEMIDGYVVDFYFNEDRSDYAIVVTPVVRDTIPAFMVTSDGTVLAFCAVDSEGDLGPYGPVIEAEDDAMESDDEYSHLDMDEYNQPGFDMFLFLNAAMDQYVIYNIFDPQLGGSGWISSTDGSYVGVFYDLEMGFSSEEIMDAADL